MTYTLLYYNIEEQNNKPASDEVSPHMMPRGAAVTMATLAATQGTEWARTQKDSPQGTLGNTKFRNHTVNDNNSNSRRRGPTSPTTPTKVISTPPTKHRTETPPTN